MKSINKACKQAIAGIVGMEYVGKEKTCNTCFHLEKDYDFGKAYGSYCNKYKKSPIYIQDTKNCKGYL